MVVAGGVAGAPVAAARGDHEGVFGRRRRWWRWGLRERWRLRQGAGVGGWERVRFECWAVGRRSWIFCRRVRGSRGFSVGRRVWRCCCGCGVGWRRRGGMPPAEWNSAELRRGGWSCIRGCRCRFRGRCWSWLLVRRCGGVGSGRWRGAVEGWAARGVRRCEQGRTWSAAIASSRRAGWRPRNEDVRCGRLTAQELAVARLVAVGLSNRQVAAELFVGQDDPVPSDADLRQAGRELPNRARRPLPRLRVICGVIRQARKTPRVLSGRARLACAGWIR